MQIVEFLHQRFGIDPAYVAPAYRAQPFTGRDTIGEKMVFVEKSIRQSTGVLPSTKGVGSRPCITAGGFTPASAN